MSLNKKISFSGSYKKEKMKAGVLSAFIVVCSIAAPVSFSLLIQAKFNPILAFTVGLGLVFTLFILAYIRSEILIKLEEKYNQVRAGMKVKKRESALMYEILQESPNFFYLKDTVDNKRMMISKEKLRNDYELEI